LTVVLRHKLYDGPDSGGDNYNPAADPAKDRLIASVLQEIPNVGKNDTPPDMLTIAMSGLVAGGRL
jgi:hypothetical protein